MNQNEAVAASNLVSSATLAALLRCLLQKGTLEARDVREVYESALLLLEQQQGISPKGQEAFIAARAAIEQSLQGSPSGAVT
jgi:hypothetical protein